MSLLYSCGGAVTRLTTSLGASIFGYDLGVIAYVIEAPDFLEHTNLQGDSKFVQNYLGFIVSSMLLG